ncbi:hypothetical protein ACFSTC_53875 [Nonomuraea ferruginea]
MKIQNLSDIRDMAINLQEGVSWFAIDGVSCGKIDNLRKVESCNQKTRYTLVISSSLQHRIALLSLEMTQCLDFADGSLHIRPATIFSAQQK